MRVFGPLRGQPTNDGCYMRALSGQRRTTTWFILDVTYMTTRTRTLSLAMICLMVFSTTLVHAATISTFANGNSDVDVELRDQGTWGDDLTAGISMPAGETVNAAGFIGGTDYAEHDDVQVIDSSLIANGEIWNPIYNGGMTQYSSIGDFTAEETFLQLTSQGYNADFEGGQDGSRKVNLSSLDKEYTALEYIPVDIIISSANSL